MFLGSFRNCRFINQIFQFPGFFSRFICFISLFSFQCAPAALEGCSPAPLDGCSLADKSARSLLSYVSYFLPEVCSTSFGSFLRLSRLAWLPFCFRFRAGLAYRLSLLVGLSGLEPPTSRLSGVRSNRLSYKPMWFPASGSHRLPFFPPFRELFPGSRLVVEMNGIEPMTPCLQSRCSPS